MPSPRQSSRFVPSRLIDRVVVAVLMGDEHEVSIGAFNRRIVELHSSRCESFHRAEGIDEDRSLAAKQKRRLAVHSVRMLEQLERAGVTLRD